MVPLKIQNQKNLVLANLEFAGYMIERTNDINITKINYAFHLE